MKLIDGRKIAQDIFTDTAALVKKLDKTPVLVAITCAPNFETQKYLEMKKRKAAEVGISLRVVELPAEATTADAVNCIKAVSAEAEGIVVQLPLPSHIDRETVLRAVPTNLDPDGFSYDGSADTCLPPVVGVIKEILEIEDISVADKKVVVLGQGRLVGAPAAVWLKNIGADVQVLLETDTNHDSVIKQADIIISGIGQPNFITPDMVKPGVVVLDAGTSEDGGVLVGDVHPAVAQVASLFTPVPGGIGPITIALLLRNVVSLVKE